ncbi:polymorphic toxin-type HINT domain-containing protein [Dactylosporangium sp. CA-092794]|uniref:polymorphic toxin-type HINT domain-containing protein n=1 Tax=Dactylosporangium sp. CA-092794 TaxID=3239929 RepID=UPI003D8BAC3D
MSAPGSESLFGEHRGGVDDRDHPSANGGGANRRGARQPSPQDDREGRQRGAGSSVRTGMKKAFGGGSKEAVASRRTGGAEGSGGGRQWRSEESNGSRGDGGGGCTAAGEHSFAPDTLVLLADGAAKPIKDVAVGDQVLSTDPRTGNTEAKTVQLLHRNHDTDLTDVTVRIDDRNPGDVSQPDRTEVLHTTWHHPFWDETVGKWVYAQDLKVGQALRTLDGDLVVVIVLHNFVGAAQMDDLTVADVHTYYVVVDGEVVLVHNRCKDKYHDRGRDPRATHGGQVRYGGLDDHGRPTGVHAQITKDMLDTGAGAGNRTPAGWPGNGSDHNVGRGHLLAQRLGGRGWKENLVTMTQYPTNSPIMRDDIEDVIFNAVDAGENIQYSAVPHYLGDNPIPDKIVITAVGNRRFNRTWELPNPAGMFGFDGEL